MIEIVEKEEEAIWRLLANPSVMGQTWSPRISEELRPGLRSLKLISADAGPDPDQWDGYPIARQRVVDFLRERPLRDAVVLTGDIHATGAAWVPGVTPGTPDTFTTPVATEWVTQGISSTGFPPDLAALAETIFQSYPHIEYFQATTRGYVRHEVGRDEWRADFRFVDASGKRFSGATKAPILPIRAAYDEDADTLELRFPGGMFVAGKAEPDGEATWQPIKAGPAGTVDVVEGREKTKVEGKWTVTK